VGWRRCYLLTTFCNVSPTLVTACHLLPWATPFHPSAGAQPGAKHLNRTCLKRRGGRSRRARVSPAGRERAKRKILEGDAGLPRYFPSVALAYLRTLAALSCLRAAVSIAMDSISSVALNFCFVKPLRSHLVMLLSLQTLFSSAGVERQENGRACGVPVKACVRAMRAVLRLLCWLFGAEISTAEFHIFALHSSRHFAAAGRLALLLDGKWARFMVLTVPVLWHSVLTLLPRHSFALRRTHARNRRALSPRPSAVPTDLVALPGLSLLFFALSPVTAANARL